MATELLENTIATLKVLRTSDQGAFLDGQTGNTNDDILLHKDQQTSPVAIGDEVEVFLYRDPKGRLTASMRLPAMKVGQIGYVEVINTTNFGCFVEVGTERGIFILTQKCVVVLKWAKKFGFVSIQINLVVLRYLWMLMTKCVAHLRLLQMLK